MASRMRLLAAIVLLAAVHQAAAGAVKATKYFAVNGISKTGSDPAYKFPVFKTVQFTYSECRGHAADTWLTIKDVQGAPSIQFYRSTAYPEQNGIKIMISTSVPRIQIITFSPSQEVSRLTIDLRAFAYSSDRDAYQASVVADLKTVASYAASFTAAWKQQDCNTNVPYNKDIAKVVAYINNLVAAMA